MRNTLESPQEHLERGSKNISRHPPQNMTIFTPLVTISPLETFSIVGREDQNLSRWIKEALFIRVNNPSLNNNIGKYHLPHIWDEVLLNTSELKLTLWPFHLPPGNNIYQLIFHHHPVVAIPSATWQ